MTFSESMEESQDKSDLLALFHLADELHDLADNLHAKVQTFGEVVKNMRIVAKKQQQELWDELGSVRKWKPMLEYFDRTLKEEKVLKFQRAKESDTGI